MNELTKVQQIALKMLEGKTDIIRINDEQKIQFIVEAHKFAMLFLEISEDPEMTWNDKPESKCATCKKENICSERLKADVNDDIVLECMIYRGTK